MKYGIHNRVTKPAVALSFPLSQDTQLGDLVTASSGTEIDWEHISGVLNNGRSGSQCCSRWQKVLHPQTIKGAWTAEVCIYCSSMPSHVAECVVNSCMRGMILKPHLLHSV